MNKQKPHEDPREDAAPELDPEEGADVLETREDAIEAQRRGAPRRSDDDIISLDPSD